MLMGNRKNRNDVADEIEQPKFSYLLNTVIFTKWKNEWNIEIMNPYEYEFISPKYCTVWPIYEFMKKREYFPISINTFALFNWKPGQSRNIPARNWNNWWLDPAEPDHVAHSPTSESISSINYLSYYTMNGINRVCFRRIYNFITMKN